MKEYECMLYVYVMILFYLEFNWVFIFFLDLELFDLLIYICFIIFVVMFFIFYVDVS